MFKGELIRHVSIIFGGQVFLSHLFFHVLDFVISHQAVQHKHPRGKSSTSISGRGQRFFAHHEFENTGNGVFDFVDEK